MDNDDSSVYQGKSLHLICTFISLISDGGPKCLGIFNRSYTTFELGKPLKPCVLPNVCSPKATSHIVKVAGEFFHSLKQNMKQICCSFKCAVFYVHQTYKWKQALVTMKYSNIHKVKLYSKQKMNQQTLLYLQLVHSFHWHVQNAVIPCHSQELLPFFSIVYFSLPLFSTNYASVLPHFVQPSISRSSSWSCCVHFHTQYSFGNSIFFPFSVHAQTNVIYLFLFCLL